VRLTGQLDHNDPPTTSQFSDYTCERVAGSGTGQTGIVTESHSKLGLTRNAPTVYAYPVGVNVIHSGVVKEWVMGG
jgi:hypothetical protein